MRSIYRLPVTGPTQERAVENAKSLLEALEAGGDENFESIVESAWRVARGQSRWIIAGRNRGEMFNALAEFILEGNFLATGTHRAGPRRTTFVFSGMGPQWAGMGRRLASEMPFFRERIKLIDDLMAESYEGSVWSDLKPYEVTTGLPTALAQPGNFLIQAALYDTLTAEGIVPDAVIGHSAGEVASAYAAGVYDLEEACRVAVTRGRLQALLAGRGAMLAIGLGEEEAVKLIADYDGVDLAAVNDNEAVTVAGDSDQIAALEERLRVEQVFAKTLRVEVPYHSPVMDEIADELRDQMGFIEPKPAQIELYSTVSGELSTGEEWGADYWPLNVRQPVRFAKAVEAALADGSRCFVEIAPHPVLTQSITALAPAEYNVTVTPVLSRRDDEYEVFTTALGKLAVENVGRPPRTRSAKLIPAARAPQKLWDQDPWLDDERTKPLASPSAPMLGRRVEDHYDEFDIEVSLSDQPWIDGHQAQGLGPVVPATMWAELIALAATDGEEQSVSITNLTIVSGLPVFPNPTILRLSVVGGTVRVETRPLGDTSAWALNAVASIGSPLPVSDDPAPDFNPPTGGGIDPDPLYRLFRLKGLHYTGLFRNLSNVTMSGDRSVDANGQPTGDLSAWASIDGGEPFTAGFHAPWILDAGLQLLIAAARDLGEAMYLPYRLGRVSLIRPMNDGGRYWARAEVQSRGDTEIVGAIRFFDEHGRLCAEMTDVVAVRNGSDDVSRRSYVDRNTSVLHPVTPLEVVERFLPEEEFQDELDGAVNGSTVNGSTVNGTVTEQAPSELIAMTEPHGYPVMLGEEADVDSHQVNGHQVDDEPMVSEFWLDAGQEIGGFPIDRPVMKLADVPSGEPIHLLWMVPNLNRNDDIVATFDLLNQFGELDNNAAVLTLIGAPGQHWLFGARRSATNALGRTVRLVVTDETVSSDDLQMWIAGINEHEVRLVGGTRLSRYEQLTSVELGKCEPEISSIEGNRTTLAYDLPSTARMTATIEQVRPPGPGEITMETIAVPLTWKDVGKVTGAIGNNALATFAGNHLGLGAVGRVVEAGPDTPYKPGDLVGGAVRRPFRTTVTINVEDEFVTTLNDGIDPVLQLALMMPWLTTLAALEDVARIKAGDTIFIQSGAGALGAVLCRYAVNTGCNVVTSVGTPDKVAAVRELFGESIEVVVARGDEIPGALIDAQMGPFDCIAAVVSGQARTSLFEQLRGRGRYLDLGKAQSSDEMQLASAIDGNRSLTRIDTDQIAVAEPAWFRDLLKRSLEVVSDPANHTPVTRYPIGKLRSAIVDLARGHTTGSLVVELDGEDAAVESAQRSMPRIDPEGIYLITGGYGGVGLMCAQWLVSRGAHKIVLSGRSGKAPANGQLSIDMLRAFGADVRVVACDGGDPSATKSLIDDLRAEGPIRGVIHAAGVIADGPFSDIDADRVHRSMGAKVDGATNLVAALDQGDGAWDDLSFLLFTSSLAGAFGVSIQATYAAANTALDGMAEDLRERGVHASSMQLGPIDEAGMAADDERNVRFYAASGLSMVAPRNLFTMLDLATISALPIFNTSEIDWQRVGRSEPGNAGSSVIGHLVAAASGGGDGAQLAQLLELSMADRTEVLTIAMLGLFVEALGVDEGDLSADTSFADMGIDSLAVVEIQVGVSEILQHEVPLARLFLPDGNIGQLSGRIAEYLDEIVIDDNGSDDGSNDGASNDGAQNNGAQSNDASNSKAANAEKVSA